MTTRIIHSHPKTNFYHLTPPPKKKGLHQKKWKSRIFKILLYQKYTKPYNLAKKLVIEGPPKIFVGGEKRKTSNGTKIWSLVGGGAHWALSVHLAHSLKVKSLVSLYTVWCRISPTIIRNWNINLKNKLLITLWSILVLFTFRKQHT